MLDRQWQRESEAKREQEHQEWLQLDRDWRNEQRRKDVEWRVAQERRADKRHWRELIWLDVVVSLIIGVVTIVAAFIERGALFPSSTPAT